MKKLPCFSIVLWCVCCYSITFARYATITFCTHLHLYGRTWFKRFPWCSNIWFFLHIIVIFDITLATNIATIKINVKQILMITCLCTSSNFFCGLPSSSEITAVFSLSYRPWDTHVLLVIPHVFSGLFLDMVGLLKILSLSNLFSFYSAKVVWEKLCSKLYSKRVKTNRQKCKLRQTPFDVTFDDSPTSHSKNCRYGYCLNDGTDWSYRRLTSWLTGFWLFRLSVLIVITHTSWYCLMCLYQKYDVPLGILHFKSQPIHNGCNFAWSIPRHFLGFGVKNWSGNISG